ncbi:hypothetical protein AB0N29_01860 [Nocardioides sp. NPDC092400]|uniref:hypothetical protein n=1 Tax=Nocardioides sp. NPDC092400 TaxID=3155196 RepID=UPI00341306DA
MSDEQPFDKAQARTPPKGAAPAAVNYLDLVEHYVQDNVDAIFNIGSLPEDLDEDDVGRRVGTSTRLQRAEQHGESVRLWFKSGPILSEGVAADPTGVEDDFDLTGKSTLQDFRAVIRTKKGARRAIVAVETRGRACPANALLRALKSCSDVPWRLRLHDHIADVAAVRAFVDKGTVEHLELTEWSFDDDGHKVTRLNSLVSRVAVTEQRKSKTRLKNWIRVGKVSAPDKWKKEATAVKDQFFSTKVDIPFNDVSMTVSSGNQVRTLRPSTDYRHFTYYLADKIVEDSTFFSQAGGTLDLMIDGVQDAKQSK